jgi:hypothetical protein
MRIQHMQPMHQLNDEPDAERCIRQQYITVCCCLLQRYITVRTSCWLAAAVAVVGVVLIVAAAWSAAQHYQRSIVDSNTARNSAAHLSTAVRTQMIFILNE